MNLFWLEAIFSCHYYNFSSWGFDVGNATNTSDWYYDKHPKYESLWDRNAHEINIKHNKGNNTDRESETESKSL